MDSPLDSLVVDLSNYDWDTFDAKTFYAAGVRRAIVGSQQPSLSGQMVDALRSEGIEIIATYDLPYFGSDDTTREPIERAVSFAAQYTIPRVWVDAEIDANQTNVKEWKSIPTPTVPQRQSEMRWCMDLVKTHVAGSGIYTNGAWWTPNMGGSTEWCDSPLWLATYGVGGSPTAPIETVGFGGWTTVTMHQYTSVYPINGRGRDMSYLFEEVTQEEEVTQDQFDQMLAASAPFQQINTQLTQLNAALVQRFDIIRLASGTDANGYANVQTAHDDLKTKGLVS